MMKVLVVLAVVLIGGAWLFGYWPQRQKITTLHAELAAAQQKAAAAEARVRTGALLGELRNLEEAVMRQNFGDAQQMSVTFFDHVRIEGGTNPDPAAKQALQDLAQRRDAVTSALARADGMVLMTLQEMETALRRALGYAVYGPHPAVPVAAGAPPSVAPTASAPPLTAPAASPSPSP